MAFNFNLPSVTESYANLASFPATGNVRILYKDNNNNNLYTWNGSTYVLVDKKFASSWGKVSDAPVTTTSVSKNDLSLGNVDNTSDADKPISTATQNALNAKQATLVSGTNIKTINGNSVLGSGDLVVSGGGASGLQGIQVPFNNVQGSTTFGFNASINSGNVGNVVTSASRLDVYPFTPNRTLNNCSLTINVVTLGVGVLSRIVIYSNVNSFPTTKLYESTDIDCSTIGDKVVLANFTFTAGTTYWLGFYANGVTTVRAIPIASLVPLFLPSVGSSPVVAWSRVSTTLGTAPTTFNYNTYTQSSQVTIYIRQT
jgi:hypothetical protein